MANFRSGTVTNSSTTIKSTGADVLTLNVVNRLAGVILVKFYDSPVATFQDIPYRTFQVPASTTYTVSGSERTFPLFSTSNGLAVRVVTDLTDNGNTAAGTLPIIEIQYN